MNKKVSLLLLCFLLLNTVIVLAGSGKSASNLNGIAYNGNDLYIAVGDAGTLLSSKDGQSFTKIKPVTEKNLYGVVWGGKQFVAVGEGGIILTSQDGAIWTLQKGATEEKLHNIVWNGTQYIAVGNAGTIMISQDGAKWLRVRMGTGELLYRVNWFVKQFVSVGSKMTILTSTDGITWTETMSDPASTAELSGVAWNGNKYVAVGDHLSILTSHDGLKWVSCDNLNNNLDFSAYLYDVVWGANRFVAVGDSGTILISQDGDKWEACKQVTRKRLKQIIWSGKQYIAVGEEGSVLASQDGANWKSLVQIKFDLNELSLKTGDKHNALVTMVYPDGSAFDVTDKTKYESSNSDVVRVDEKGVIKAVGPGTAFVKASFEMKSINTAVTVVDAARQENKESQEEVKTALTNNTPAVDEKEVTNNKIMQFSVLGAVLIVVLIALCIVYFANKKTHQ